MTRRSTIWAAVVLWAISSLASGAMIPEWLHALKTAKE